MAEVDTSVVDNLNSDEVVKELADVYNASTKVLRSDDEVQEIRKQRAQQQETQRALEQLKLGGEGAQAVVGAEAALKGGEKE